VCRHPPLDENDKRRRGYSRDHRFDCVLIVIALIVTAEGLPLAYEILPGNTNDSTTLRSFLAKIERQYGKAQRIWCMDRGVPTEEILCRNAPQQTAGAISRRHTARAGVKVKLLPGDDELYVFTETRDRIANDALEKSVHGHCVGA
jgi:Transposase DDE domain